MKVKVIGIGGIGCQLLLTLCRYLNYTQESLRGAVITLVDGDSFEPANSSRQAFVRPGNKASSAASLLSEMFPSLAIRAEGVYINPKNCYSILQEGDIVFLCVDNFQTRHLVSERCQDLENVLLISGGNELEDGNIQVYLRRDREDLTLPLANEFHPEIEEPADKHPEELGCAEAVESIPQLLFTNNAVATAMLNAFYQYVATGNIEYDEVYVDIRTNQFRPVMRR